MSTPTRVLAIHAHPDDVEFQCAGTLALLKRAGCEVTIATMTPGDCGSAELDCEAIAEIRRGEAKAAADQIGAEYVCLEFRDLAIFNDDDSRRRVTEALRRARPDVILTAPPVDYHCDHEATSLLVRDACFAASCPNYATRQWEPAAAHRLDSAPVLRRLAGGGGSRRPAGAGRVPRRRLGRLRDQEGDARLPRQPARLAARGSTGSTSTWRARATGARSAGRRSASPRPRGSASTRGIRTRRTTAARAARAGRPGQAGAVLSRRSAQRVV